MQEGEFEKTRILRAPLEEEQPTAPKADDGPDPNKTMIIQPTARAVAAAAALKEARRQREAARKGPEFEYSGQVDFDITATDLAPAPARRPVWRRPVLIGAVIVGILGAAAIWWGIS